MSDPAATATRLRTAIRFLIRRAETVSGKGKPPRSELDVMVLLDEKGALTPGELSTAMRVRPQTTGQTLDALTRRRWIVRKPHATDGRRVLVSLSPAGRKVLRAGRDLRQAWLTGEVGKLSPAEHRTLLDALALLERIAQCDPTSL
jgi:DNA-binding MarR family transcriptional regulator